MQNRYPNNEPWKKYQRMNIHYVNRVCHFKQEQFLMQSSFNVLEKLCLYQIKKTSPKINFKWLCGRLMGNVPLRFVFALQSFPSEQWRHYSRPAETGNSLRFLMFQFWEWQNGSPFLYNPFQSWWLDILFYLDTFFIVLSWCDIWTYTVCLGQSYRSSYTQ